MKTIADYTIRELVQACEKAETNCKKCPIQVLCDLMDLSVADWMWDEMDRTVYDRPLPDNFYPLEDGTLMYKKGWKVKSDV